MNLGDSKKAIELTRQYVPVASNPKQSPVPAIRNKILPKVLGHVAKCPTDSSLTANDSKTAENDSANNDQQVKGGDRKEETALPARIRQKVACIVQNAVIGLDQLQEQVQRLAIRRGFTLNIMVVGRSGLGKSTLINTLFRSSILSHGSSADGGSLEKTTEIRTTQAVIQESEVKLNLTVTDTPGFGDRIDNTNCWEPALQYIDEQYEKYLNEEQSANRNRWIADTRIHCCLYFIPPTGHGLRPLDVEVLKRLHNVVNVIPVMAKADTLTVEEREEFRRNIQQDLNANRIETYPLAKYEHFEDYQLNQSYRELMPFAVVGSEQVHQVKGRSVLGRQNGWGLIEVEDPSHCEFHLLKNLLIRNRMQDLIELTSAIHYEAFRRRRLMETNGLMIDLDSLNESHI